MCSVISFALSGTAVSLCCWNVAACLTWLPVLVPQRWVLFTSATLAASKCKAVQACTSSPSARLSSPHQNSPAQPPVNHCISPYLTPGLAIRSYDLLLRYRLHIVGETSLAINHCLVALPGTKMENITRVMSHPQVCSLSACLPAIV